MASNSSQVMVACCVMAVILALLPLESTLKSAYIQYGTTTHCVARCQVCRSAALQQFPVAAVRPVCCACLRSTRLYLVYTKYNTLDVHVIDD